MGTIAPVWTGEEASPDAVAVPFEIWVVTAKGRTLPFDMIPEASPEETFEEAAAAEEEKEKAVVVCSAE